MITLLLATLEGNEKNSKVARRLVQVLVDNKDSLLATIKFLCSMIRLQDSMTYQAFKNYDINNDGWISTKSVPSSLALLATFQLLQLPPLLSLDIIQPFVGHMHAHVIIFPRSPFS